MLFLHVCLSARQYDYTRTSKLSFVKLGEEADMSGAEGGAGFTLRERKPRLQGYIQ